MESRPHQSGRRKTSQGFWDQASHDLRQPVQSLQLLSKIFAGRQADETLRQCADHMRRVVDDLARMHSALLHLVRLECGEERPRGGVVALRPLMQEIVQGLSGEARERKVDLRCAGVEASVEADAGSLALLLRGLIVLALCQAEGGAIVVRETAHPDGPSIAIEFEGGGVAAAQSAAVFFEAAGPEGARTILGPHYLARLSRLLGYQLDFDEGQANGKRFTLTIPRGDST